MHREQARLFQIWHCDRPIINANCKRVFGEIQKRALEQKKDSGSAR
jgi:hypothetical protein